MSEENTGTSLEQAMIDNVQEQAAEAVEATEETQQPQEELSAEEKEAAEKEAATKAAEAALGGGSDEAEAEGAGETSASAGCPLSLSEISVGSSGQSTMSRLTQVYSASGDQWSLTR